MQVIEELQGQHEMALEKISQLESIITQQSVDMVSVEFEIEFIFKRPQGLWSCFKSGITSFIWIPCIFIR